jgi:hypothetical protein
MATDAPDQLTIPLSRTKIALLPIGAAMFVVLSFWLWVYADRLSRLNFLYVRTAAILGIGFFGLCGLYAVFKLFDRAPGLIVDAEGIIDNSSGLSAGRIQWSDICGFQITSLYQQRFLAIEIRAAEKYVLRAPLWKRPLVALNAKYFGSPIQISANTLKIDFDRLVKLLADSHARQALGSSCGKQSRVIHTPTA